jgi:ribosomal protein S20
MPIIKSAKKRVRTARKATIRNSKTKRAIRSTIKLFIKKMSSDSLSSAQSAIDTAVKKRLISKNKAARMKKQLAAKAKTASTNTAAGKKSTAKKVVKKTTVKKTTTTKKPAAKKRSSPSKK